MNVFTITGNTEKDDVNTCVVKDNAGDLKPCIFPFDYKNRTYETCSNADVPLGRSWCPIDLEKYDQDPEFDDDEYLHYSYCDANPNCPKPWNDQCLVQEFSSGLELSCQFPFVYKNVTYTKCTNFESTPSQYWCATEVEDESREYLGEKWGFCSNEECTKPEGNFI